MGRWWIYQRERFPILAHGALIAAFSSSAVSFSMLVRGESSLPSAAGLLVAFGTSFLFFLQLRIADEFKDFDEDKQYRPYRPVPRGLVTLRELGVVAAAAAVLQLCLAAWLEPRLLLLLGLTWAYLVVMSKEFFVRDWLIRHPLVYMFSHMVILPLVDLYATACDWMVGGASLPPRLWPFLAVSYANGCALELGRKIRAPEDEEAGVATYTALWGRNRAVATWLIALAATGCFGLVAAVQIDFILPVVMVLGTLLTAAALISHRFLLEPATARAKWFEPFSGVWTLLVYLILGVVPLVWRWWQAA